MGFKARTSPRGSLFSNHTFQFLVDLHQNNDRDWFAANKELYEQRVREPALEFIRQMAPYIQRISKHFEASDKRMGGSLMRIHRDTRFAADKTPYKTNVGIHFRHRGGADVHGPGLYVHIAPDGCFLGVGSWRPEPESLLKIRRRIVERPGEWAKARDDLAFRRWFELGGDSLKRTPKGFEDATEYVDDLRRKDHTAVAELRIDDVLGPGLVSLCAKRFAAAAPYLRFLTKTVGAPF